MKKRIVVAAAALAAVLAVAGALAVPRGLDALATSEFGSPGRTAFRMTPERARAAADAVPPGARVDAARNRVVFAGPRVEVTVLAAPAGAEMSFRIAGLTNPTLEVPADARVEVRFVNADPKLPHGWAVLRRGDVRDEPLRDGRPAFAGAVGMLFDKAGAGGLPAQTVTFAAGPPGRYAYVCQVGDHARMGMMGTFEVAG